MQRNTSLILIVVLSCVLALAAPLSAFGASFSVNTPAPQTSNGITATVSYSGSISGPGTVFEEGETVTISVDLSGTAVAAGAMYYRVFSPTVPYAAGSDYHGGFLLVTAGEVVSTTGFIDYTFIMPSAPVTDMTLIWGFGETPSVTMPTLVATPNVLPHTGGTSVVYGANIQYFFGPPSIEAVIVYDGSTEVTRGDFTIFSPTSGLTAVVMPPNTSTTTDKVYTLQLYLSHSPDVVVTTTVTVLKAPPVSVSYPILQHFTDFTGKGTSSALIDASAGGTFVSLLYQGNAVDPAHYTATTDLVTLITTITLSEAYLKTLPNGSYEFVAVYSDGQTEPISLLVNVGAAPLPPTGDAGAVLGFASVMAMLVGGSVLTAGLRRVRLR